MLKLNKLTYGLIPFGPASGMPALQLKVDYVDNTETIIDQPTLFEQLSNEIKDRKLENILTKAIDGSQSVFFIFSGGGIEKDEAAQLWDEFNIELSRLSVNTQKALKLQPDKLKPPFCIWAGIPQNFTGKRSFFQYFNCVYALIDNPNYSQLALQEIINHQFSVVCLMDTEITLSILDDENGKKLYDDLVKKFKLNHKLNIVSSRKAVTAEKCLDLQLKYSHNNEGAQFLKLI